MGFFSDYSNTQQNYTVKSCDKYTWNNLITDSRIFVDGIFHAGLFTYSQLVYAEYVQKLEESDELDTAIDFITNNVDRIHYEEALQYQALHGLVDMGLGTLFDTIEIVKNIDGQRTQEYFSGFTLNKEQVADSLTQNISQIISREYAFYLREYLTNLENLKRYVDAIKNTDDNLAGRLISNFIGGAMAVANPLIGVGLIAKNIYDIYDDNQKENSQTEKFNSILERFHTSMDKLSESQENVCINISSFINNKITDAFNELGSAVTQYCIKYNFDIYYICDMIFKSITSNDDIDKLKSNFSDDAKYVLFMLFNYVKNQKALYPGTKLYVENFLQELQ